MMSRDLDGKRLFVRVDASPEIGIGHFMRCLSLAQYWRDQRGDVTFIGQYPSPLFELLASEGIEHIAVDKPYPDPADLAGMADAIPASVPVVVDGYHFDATYHRYLATNDRRVLVIDDNGHLPEYGGHLLLNQTSGGERIAYGNAPETRLVGTRYVLLGRGFRKQGRDSRRASDEPRQVLITLGGADPANVTLDMLEVLVESSLGTATVRVIAGPANPHLESLRHFVADQPGFELRIGEADMPSAMAWADLALAAAGTTCWELAYMGVPMVLTAIAKNQQLIATDLERRHAALYIGPSPRLDRPALIDAIELLAGDPAQRLRLSRNARQLVDGRGAERVAAALCDKFA